MPWTTLQLQVTTPLFCAGDDQTGSAVRVPSLRGAMRFWFRALAGTIAGDDLTLLARMEEAVFGSAQSPSPVSMRIRGEPKATSRNSAPKFIQEPPNKGGRRGGPVGRGIRQPRDDGKWVVYLLGQGLADAADRTLRRDFIDVGRPVSVDFRFSGNESVDTLVLASLWLLCMYGGLGARTRRGFGGLAITGAEGDLPGDWSPETVLTPGHDYFEQQTCLWPADRMMLWQYCLTDLPGVTVDPPDQEEAWTRRPSYPVLSRQWTRAELWRGKPEPEWTRVLGYAGEQYRWFRAKEDTPGVRYTPEIKTPEWRTVTGRVDDNQFALGALGLPIVFKKAGPTVHADQRPRPGAKPDLLRRASPLWLRVVGRDKEWKLFSFAFRGDFLPGDADVHVYPDNVHQGRELTVTSDDVDERTNEWLDAVRDRNSFIRNQEPQ